MRDPAELRRAAAANLAWLLSDAGKAALAREKREREAKSAERKADKKRIKQIQRRIPRLEAERDALQAFLDELLEAAEPSMSADDVDHALEGCVAELGDLRDELKLLESKYEG